MTTALIIDDTKRDRDHLIGLLREHDDIDIAQQCVSGKEGLEAIDEHKPQLIFLDIEMSPMDGFQMLEKIKNKYFEVIFTTAHNEFGVKALNLVSLHYLLKPIIATELEEALNKFRSKENERNRQKQYNELLYNVQDSGTKNKKIGIASIDKHGEKTMDFYLIENIVYCNTPAKDGDDSKGAYTTFHFKDQAKVIASESIGHYEKILSDYDFFRPERGYLINMECLKSMRDFNGLEVILEYYPDVRIPVSRRYKAIFEARLVR